jgi:hypothetical protein
MVAPLVRATIGDGEITMSNGLLEAKIERLEGGKPFRLRRPRR